MRAAGKAPSGDRQRLPRGEGRGWPWPKESDVQRPGVRRRELRLLTGAGGRALGPVGTSVLSPEGKSSSW